MDYELAIIGGGPAGAAAAVYAARKRIKTILITEEWGGQSTVSTDIHNWIGTKSISGPDLAKNLREHVEAYKGEWLTILAPARAESLELADGRVTIKLNKDPKMITAKTALITTGARRRKLEVPGADTYDNKGLTYCASCDGPLFADMDVVVVGGGNAGFESALQLLNYCKSVTLLNRSDKFRADEITVAAAKSDPKMKILTNVVPTEILGEQFVTGIKYKNTVTNVETTLPVSGVFVEIGLLPNTEWINDALEMNEVHQIKVDPKTQKTSHARVWAAGDITDGLYHQNNIAAGDAVKALEDIYMYLRRSAQ